MALVWFYLQINDKPNQKLSDELLRMFDRNDFNSAFIWLMLHDETGMDKTDLEMKQLISKHFETDTGWYLFFPNSAVEEVCHVFRAAFFFPNF